MISLKTVIQPQNLHYIYFRAKTKDLCVKLSQMICNDSGKYQN